MLYTLVFDSRKYMLMLWDKEQIASIVSDDNIDHLIDINGAPIRHKAVFTAPLRVSFEARYPQDKELLTPDLCVFEGRLFLNEKAYEAVAGLIESDGEFLDVVDEKGNKGFVFTPLRIAEDVNGLDLEFSKKNEWGDVVHLAFKEYAVKNWTVFRTEFNGYMTLHCDANFKKAIEDAQLSGLYITNDLASIFPDDRASVTAIN
jgi:hypothetical protein